MYKLHKFIDKFRQLLILYNVFILFQAYIANKPIAKLPATISPTSSNPKENNPNDDNPSLLYLFSLYFLFVTVYSVGQLLIRNISSHQIIVFQQTATV